MVIERTQTETVIRIPTSLMTTAEVQDLLDYLLFREIAAKSKATRKDVNQLAKAVKKGQWAANKHRLAHHENHHR